MPNGKPALPGEGRQFQLPVQLGMDQFRHPTPLPGSQPAAVREDRLASAAIFPDEVLSDHGAERVHEKLREHFLLLQARKNQLCEVMEGRVVGSIGAVQFPNCGNSGVIRKGIQRGTRHMVVHPVDGSWVSNARIRLQVAHSDSPDRPLSRLGVFVVGPKFPFAGPCRIENASRQHRPSPMG